MLMVRHKLTFIATISDQKFGTYNTARATSIQSTWNIVHFRIFVCNVFCQISMLCNNLEYWEYFSRAIKTEIRGDISMYSSDYTVKCSRK